MSPRPNPDGHDHYESAVIYIEPVGTADAIVIAVVNKWTVDILA
jgi:hypothetical protein